MSKNKPYQMFVDSGLLIICNWKPNEIGFIEYKSQPKSWFEWNEESLANKGMLYGYWIKDDIGTIVINTHITTQSLIKKYLELQELQTVIQELKHKYKHNTKYLEIYVIGDFNIPYNNSYLQQVMENRLDFKRLTDHVQDEIQGNIDQVFMWNNFDFVEEDQYKVYQQTLNPEVFVKSGSKEKYISDHAWRGIMHGKGSMVIQS